jgi:hypothetical protein
MTETVSPSRRDGFNGARDAAVIDRYRVEILNGAPVCWVQCVESTEDLLRRAGYEGTPRHEFVAVRVRRDEFLARWELCPEEVEGGKVEGRKVMLVTGDVDAVKLEGEERRFLFSEVAGVAEDAREGLSVCRVGSAFPMCVAAGSMTSREFLMGEVVWRWRAVLARRMAEAVGRVMVLWERRDVVGRGPEWLEDYRAALHVCGERQRKLRMVEGGGR